MRPSSKAGELGGIGDAEEVQIAVRRPDGVLREPVTVWLVRAGDDLYVRSAVKGRNAAWYRGVQQTHDGRISAEGVQRDVRFEAADPALNDQIDAAYRDKYRRYAGPALDACLTPEARLTTTRVVPG